MERDALLSHGVAFCLHDRWVRCTALRSASNRNNLLPLLITSPSLLFPSLSFPLFLPSDIRLMNCSDNHLAYVCSSCGGLLSVYSQQQETASSGMLYGGETLRILPYSVTFDMSAIVVPQCWCLILMTVHNPDKVVCSCQSRSLLVYVTPCCRYLMPLTYVTSSSMSFHHCSFTQLDEPIITLRL